MATIIAVHGTYANYVGNPGTEVQGPGADLQWWQNGSLFEEHIREMVEGEDGKLNFEPFSWTGDNSESARRMAAVELRRRLDHLEAEGEAYCIIGHSHGGSVISSALLETSAEKKDLAGLRRWITVGTPFVELRRERFLFTRITLIEKAMYVASLMLLFMFGFFVVGEIVDDRSGLADRDYLQKVAVSLGLMSVPFLIFYAIVRWRNERTLFRYRPRTLNHARSTFMSRWLGMHHEDDEAVNGLRSLRYVDFNLFDRTFAVSAISASAVFVLPLIYLIIVFSPSTMLSIYELLRDKVYTVEEVNLPEAEVRAKRREIRGMSRMLRRAREQANDVTRSANEQLDAQSRIRELQPMLREARDSFRTSYPDFDQFARAERFKTKFTVHKGKKCEGDTLCGEGKDWILNSKLLFHLVTDEVTSAVVDEEFRHGVIGNIIRFLVPVLVVPLVFLFLGVTIMVLVRYFAGIISAGLSRLLDRWTWAEVKRSALGNDTEGETTVGADTAPFWASESFLPLPMDVGHKITLHSNTEAGKSLDKLRNAISDLAFSETRDGRSDTISKYLTWRELIHTTYFEVPEFRKLVAEAIVNLDGFRPTQAFMEDPDRKQTAVWLAQLRPMPGA